MKHVIAQSQRRKTVYGIIFVVEIEQKQAICNHGDFFEKNGILHVMLTYYIKLYKYINFLLLYLQFCDHSKHILTD